MLIAGTMDLSETLASLALRRPAFHSERDFQVALAWAIQTSDPEMKVYLETRPVPGVHLDLALEREGFYTAVELKYLTRRWTGEVGGQRFELTDQSAHDTRRFGVVKDLWRVESFVAEAESRGIRANGAVVVLTNDATYRQHAGRPGANDAAFSIDDGVILPTRPRWAKGPPSGAIEFATEIELAGEYRMGWSEYEHGVAEAPQMWQLVIEVPGARA